MVTKTKDIREEIINWFIERNPDKPRSWAEWETKMLFIRQKAQGVVLKVEGELYTSLYKTLSESFPLPFRMADDEIADLVKLVVDDIRKAGYTATKPLIEASPEASR